MKVFDFFQIDYFDKLYFQKNPIIASECRTVIQFNAESNTINHYEKIKDGLPVFLEEKELKLNCRCIK